METEFNTPEAKEAKLSKEYAVKSSGEMSIKDVDLDKRVVTGFYNTYNYFDSDADVLLDGAAKNSISQHGPESPSIRKIKHALNHDLSQLPGKIMVLEEREIDGLKGIYFETRMSKTQLGVDTLINYQEEIYDNHSIGFRYLDMEFIDSESEEFDKVLATLANPEDAQNTGYMWLVKEIMLFEGSTVAIGANQLTPFLGVKSNDPELIKAKLTAKMSVIENALRKGKQSDDSLYDLSISLRQIKQLVNEMDPSATQKTTPDRGPVKVDFIKRLEDVKFI